MPNILLFKSLIKLIKENNAQLVAVSKTRSVDEISSLYQLGQKTFGENRVQELIEKFNILPKDIQWHMIGHLQTKKVKYIAPFVSMIHSVDSLKLATEINKHAHKHDRNIDILLQLHIAKEESKYGFNFDELKSLLDEQAFINLEHINICGVMGMATFTEDTEIIRSEFKNLKVLFDTLKTNYFEDEKIFNQISMGMSGDYKIALEEGSTMIRVGSALFGPRD